MHILRAFGVIVLMSGCAGSPNIPASARTAPEPEQEIVFPERFLAVPVEERLRQALASGDTRFLGVYGYALMVPGVPANPISDRSLSNVLPIPGTSDSSDSPRERKFNQEAIRYAEAYNLKLLGKN